MSHRTRFRSHPNSSLDHLKSELCRTIEYEMLLTQMPQVQLAMFLGTSQANLSRVINRKVKHLSFNQLFRYLVLLRPHCRLLIAPR